MLEEIKNIFLGNNVQNKCILVIEDNQVDGKLLLSILNKKYSKVLVVENARNGLEMARNNAPDLIVLDYNLPDIQGGDVLTELKSDNKTKKIPVIILTSERTPANICESFSNNAECYLLKPINQKTLLDEIDKNLKENTSS